MISPPSTLHLPSTPWIVFSVVTCLFTLPHPSAGAKTATPAGTDLPIIVQPPRRPTEVSVGFYLLGLVSVSAPSEAFPEFEAAVSMNASWNDQRLSFTPEGIDAHVYQEEEAERRLKEIWWPNLRIRNRLRKRKVESVELVVQPDGDVTYKERFRAVVHAELNLNRFPFDSQTFDIEMEPFGWDQGSVVLAPDEHQSGFDADYRTPEWSVTGIETFVEAQRQIPGDRKFSVYTFRIRASRQSEHYLLRYLVPLVFVMGLTWCALWMPVGQRFRVGFVALLTVVASHTVVSGQLPRMQGPTFLDCVLIVCYLFASILIIESIWVQRIEQHSEERARMIDGKTRVLLPIGAAVILWVAFLIWG